jgi:hypothetical protein
VYNTAEDWAPTGLTICCQATTNLQFHSLLPLHGIPPKIRTQWSIVSLIVTFILVLAHFLYAKKVFLHLSSSKFIALDSQLRYRYIYIYTTSVLPWFTMNMHFFCFLLKSKIPKKITFLTLQLSQH